MRIGGRGLIASVFYLLTIGCTDAPPDSAMSPFAGTWTYSAGTTTVTCDDGSPPSVTNLTGSFVIVESAPGQLQIGQSTWITFTINGNQATAQPSTFSMNLFGSGCNGHADKYELLHETLTLDATQTVLSIESSISQATSYPCAPPVTCTSDVAGTATKL